MSKVFIEESTLSSIGDAIREKTGKSDLIAPGDMPTEIGAITGGGDGSSGSNNEIPASFIDGSWTGEFVNSEITSIREGSFYNTHITAIDCPNVIRLESYALAVCYDLQKINLPKLQFIDSYSLSFGTINMLGGNKYIEYIDFPELIWMNSDSSLVGCANVEELNLPKCEKVAGLSGFNSLKKLVLPAVCALYNVLGYCSSKYTLQTVICPNFGNTNKNAKYSNRSMSFGINGTNNFRTLPLLDTFVIGGKNYIVPLTSENIFQGTPISDGTGYIYVRQSLIEEYKIATNWSQFADQFRAIEDYPEIEAEVNKYADE